MEKYCLGIDIGGTSVKFGLFDLGGTLVEKWSIPTDTENNGAHILSGIAASAEKKLAKRGIGREQVAGAGVGVPGQVGGDGSVLLAENVGWSNVPLTRELSEMTGLHVRADNDANLAALGELWKGSARDCHSMMFVTLGTGIGCGIVVNGKILSGAGGAAGEIGHMHIEDRMTEQCTCGKYGCLEQFASATGIQRLGRWELEASEEPSLLRHGEVSAKTVFEAVKRKDALAVRVAEKFGEYLGKALANCTCVLNPEVVVIGGGVSGAGEILLDYIQKYYRRYAYPPCADTRFRLASLGSDAGIYGGARLAIGEK